MGLQAHEPTWPEEVPLGTGLVVCRFGVSVAKATFFNTHIQVPEGTCSLHQ
jgi:hypothetical protein